MHFLTEWLSFLHFFFHPYPKSGHCASFWIYALFVYIDSKRSKISKKRIRCNMCILCILRKLRVVFNERAGRTGPGTQGQLNCPNL